MQKLSEKESEYLERLKKVLKFGSKIFKKTKILEKDYKSNFLRFSFGAIHNYSEAIYVLCKKFRPHAAQIILRSIFEAHCNMLYFVNTNSNLKLAKYALWDFEEREKMLKGFLNFVQKYPNWENKYGLTNKLVLNDLILKNQKNIDAIKRGNKFYKTTKIENNLRERVQAYDRKVRTKEKGGWELNYLIFYKYSSPFAHLTPSGIDNFIEDEETANENFCIDQSRKNIEAILITTLEIYISLLNYLNKRKVIPDNISLKIFNKK